MVQPNIDSLWPTPAKGTRLCDKAVCSEKDVVFSGNKWCLLRASVTPSLRAPQVSGLLLQRV